ncbi:MAG: SDR family oxidoreductase [Bdellovibrionaceae bacterium]|nr:SDR family oxidoreductase [Pseudobdellovibrionaceae bacterium]MDW8190765.1 SDR family oxidoreductase [Pseudobdellovibrionaceae bacterium]
MEVVIVTGASQGIGKAICRQFASEKKAVIALSRNTNLLEQLTFELSAQTPIWHFMLDLADPRSIEHGISQIKALLQSHPYLQLKGIINNAGIYFHNNPYDQRQDLWLKHMQINFLGHVQLTEALIKTLKAFAPSFIINISSTLAFQVKPGTGAYAASKAAMNQWTRVLALELAPQIRVNAIAPGIVDTPIHQPTLNNQNDGANDMKKEWGKLHPMKRIGNPEDIAQACSFLADHQRSNWITGIIMEVDGGIHLI